MATIDKLCFSEKCNHTIKQNGKDADNLIVHDHNLMRFKDPSSRKVNSIFFLEKMHSVVGWMSRNSLLEARRDIWNLSECSGFRIHNHAVY